MKNNTTFSILLQDIVFRGGRDLRFLKKTRMISKYKYSRTPVWARIIIHFYYSGVWFSTKWIPFGFELLHAHYRDHELYCYSSYDIEGKLL